jgi:hypothetical protein
LLSRKVGRCSLIWHFSRHDEVYIGRFILLYEIHQFIEAVFEGNPLDGIGVEHVGSAA